ncbi:MAG: ATP-binding protein [Anaerolineales bacterium]
MNDSELLRLFRDMESDRVERKASLSDQDKGYQAICAFANDLPNHRSSGVLFYGVNDNGTCANTPITDELLLKLAQMRDNGKILPIPSLIVQKKVLDGCEVAVVIVEPSDAPPVRYDGRIWVRVGPRRAIATQDEERRLSEKRRARDLPFDLWPVTDTGLRDLNLDLFHSTYLPSAIAPDILQQNQRTIEQQLASLRFLTPDHIPTILGILTLGIEPRGYVPGSYVQFVRFDGVDSTSPIRDQKEVGGPLPESLRQLDSLLEINISTVTDLTSAATEIRKPDYPLAAIQQLARNAIMHRNYQTSNAPVRIYWFDDRIEIQNPGGPFGQVNKANFGQPGLTDYRNPHLAEAMRNLGYVQQFGVGIAIAREQLRRNGNPDLEFTVEDTHILATLRRRA